MEEAVENRNYLAKRMTEEIMVKKFQSHNTYNHVINHTCIYMPITIIAGNHQCA